uniref:C-X-C motif chemokine n=1 Tax=Sphenodon punctatus TaxID=8508 RepID=A0A8D0GV60_SPHPU
MNCKFAVTILAIFLLCAALSEGMTLTPLTKMGSELRCQCISTLSEFIPPRNLQEVKLIQSGPHCPNVEVIVTLKDGREVCLDPTAPWVKMIIKSLVSQTQANSDSPP